MSSRLFLVTMVGALTALAFALTQFGCDASASWNTPLEKLVICFNDPAPQAAFCAAHGLTAVLAFAAAAASTRDAVWMGVCFIFLALTAWLLELAAWLRT